MVKLKKYLRSLSLSFLWITDQWVVSSSDAWKVENFLDKGEPEKARELVRELEKTWGGDAELIHLSLYISFYEDPLDNTP